MCDGSSQSLFLLPPDDSVNWLLRCHCSYPPPHCCCDGFFISAFYFPLLLSTSPGFLGSHSSSPLCSGMASGINQSINQSVNHHLFHFLFLISLSLARSLSLSLRLGRVRGSRHSLQFGGDFVFLSQDKHILCVS